MEHIKAIHSKTPYLLNLRHFLPSDKADMSGRSLIAYLLYFLTKHKNFTSCQRAIKKQALFKCLNVKYVSNEYKNSDYRQN